MMVGHFVLKIKIFYEIQNNVQLQINNLIFYKIKLVKFQFNNFLVNGNGGALYFENYILLSFINNSNFQRNEAKSITIIYI